MTALRVLVACEFSGIVREAFRKRGHDAWSCDLLRAEDGSDYHFQMDVMDIVCGKWEVPSWDLMIAHPPCTYLGVSGFHWCYHYPKKPKPGVLYGPERLKAAEEAIEFVRKLMNAKIPKIAIENPVSVISSRIRPADQTLQPWYYGHPEFKATCIWRNNLPELMPTNILMPPKKGNPEYVKWAKVHHEPPGPDRWKNRSRTYQGIADAMAEQWGSALTI